MQLIELLEPLVVTDSDLEESPFSGVALHDVRFADTRMTAARFENLSGAIVSRAKPARLGNVDLSGVHVQNATLAGATIQNANLSGVSISDCDVSKMRINGYLVSDSIAAYRKTQSCRN
jgi:uncharacterized protein YjbI with pentapeptide repeats